VAERNRLADFERHQLGEFVASRPHGGGDFPQELASDRAIGSTPSQKGITGGGDRLSRLRSPGFGR